MEKTVLAIDPGTAKCGLALVRRLESRHLEILWRAIVPREQLVESLDTARDVARYELAIIGSGTESKQVTAEVRAHLVGVALLVVDEKDTTMHARERYWFTTRGAAGVASFPPRSRFPPSPSTTSPPISSPNASCRNCTRHPMT